MKSRGEYVMKMVIKKELKRRLDNYIRQWHGQEETGGFLLENRRGNVSEFVPTPNASETPNQCFKSIWGSLKVAEKYAYSKGMTVVAFFHSHPAPCIMSAADLSASGSIYPDLKFVTITPTSTYSYDTDYIWYACKGVQPVKIEEV